MIKGRDNIERPVSLSPRMAAIAKSVSASPRVIDIGTDHAKLPIFLVQTGVCKTALATDIRKGPLNTALSNIKKHKVCDKINIVLTDGLIGIDINPNDCVIISGIGGFEIISILSDIKTFPGSFVLQPQKSFRELRKFLSENGFEIVKETISVDSGKYYIIIKTVYTGEKYFLSPEQELAGPYILSQKPEHFIGYMDHLIEKIKKQSRGEKSLKIVLRNLESELEKYENK